jgi:hypothetical protein
MEQLLSNDTSTRLNGQPRRIGFGVIPRFIFAAMLSTAYMIIALQKSELQEGTNRIIAVLLGGFCLGLLMVTTLWFYERMESWKSAALLVAIMAIVNCSSLFDKYIPQSLHQDKDLPLLGTAELDHFVFFFPTCLIAFIGFALVLLRWRNALRTVPVAIVSAVIATLTFVYIVEQQRGSWVSPLSAEGLGILWQITLAFFLGLSLWVEQIVVGAAPLPDQSLRNGGGHWVGNGFISLGILITCFSGVQLWTSAAINQHRKMEAQHQEQIRVELAKSLSDAPSRDNLPPLAQEPIEAILLEKAAGCTRFGPKSKMLPAEEALPAIEKKSPRALHPQRYSYTATYSDMVGSIVPVEVTSFPTTDWARYGVRHTPGPNMFILYPDHVWKPVKFGNNIYQVFTSYFWRSGNKIIFLDCRNAQQSVIDAMLKAFLEKYPSSV